MATRQGKRRLPSPARNTAFLRLLIAVAAVAVVAIAAMAMVTRPAPATAQACAPSSASTGTGVGQCAPNFTLDDVQGKSVSLSNFHGHLVLIHFWAVGCTTCAAEYPDFSRIVRAFVPKGLVVLAVDA
ncbi:MAG TPA: redoxin domain-containing protein, partial [Chloroflexota bacterium]|nr:redoxin domain-containing protein [Chloroflexota bacterium]